MSHTGRPGEPEQRPGATGPTHRPAATPQGAPAPAAGGWASEPTDPTLDPAGPTLDPVGDAAPASGRPAWLVPVAIGVAVLVVIGIVLGIVLTRDGGGDAQGATPAASTVVAPPPTPAVEPAARTATTAFAAALPTTVLQYALESSQDDAEWLGAGALEAYTETFTDGDGATLTVRAAQLETPQDATALLQQLTAALPVAAPAADPSASAATDAAADATETPADLPQTGEVLVAGTAVGTFTVVDAGDGTGVAVWQNATAVFRITAPLADIFDAYQAYGL
ncbi:hypothetical protein [Cellulomonas sp. S1-8]|uniref:hypothetical protein n=1 Tax=Cellulomonas sp. S1-8 TaxID=2904790 RepID=UPI002243AC14|nr:hypothetical protein [Cellulomonas sp. S1-8]UZN03957.1 hypothetical protein OKX07_03170 [Cellulomonas sp. S1-8]